MKIIHIETLLSRGDYAQSQAWLDLRNQILEEIRKIDWPPGTGKFSIYPESGKARGLGNGVKPIKDGFVQRLIGLGWKAEQPMNLATRVRPGRLDAVNEQPGATIAIEWETGNISSSHRALNKMALGILKRALTVGLLVVPSRNLYRFLTDRVGNFDELEPYLDLWKALQISEGVLEIIVVEHDEEDTNSPRIPKGTDGRAIV